MVSKIEDSHIHVQYVFLRILQTKILSKRSKRKHHFLLSSIFSNISFLFLKYAFKKKTNLHKKILRIYLSVKKPENERSKGIFGVHIPTYEKTIIHKVKWSGCYLCIQETVPYFWGISIEGQDRRRRIETEAKAKVVASLCGSEFIQFLATLTILVSFPIFYYFFFSTFRPAFNNYIMVHNYTQ